MLSPDQKGRLKANLNALAAHVNPELLSAIGELAETGQVPPPVGMPVTQQARLEMAQAALAQYEREPAVFSFGGLKPIPGTGRLSDDMVQKIYDRAVDGLAVDDSIVPADGPLIAFGPGDHIAPFIDRYQTRDLIVLDPNIGAFCSDMIENDWRSIVDAVQRRGGKIIFIWNEDPIVIALAAIELVRESSLAMIDGTRLIMGYPNPLLAETARAIIERRNPLFAYNGFVEDEALLFRNAFANLLTNPHRLIEGDLGYRAPMPAVIVGSGASLNDNFSDILAARDRICVISCGTGLLPLLEHGIRPDLHCELESVPFIGDIIRFTASRHDLSGIGLIGSNTIPPDVAPLFGETAFCFREGTAASRIFTEESVPLPNIAPSCTNTGLRFAYALGFRDIYLCGIDLGSRSPESHHSDGSVYDHIDAYNAFIGDQGQRISPRGSATGAYDREVPANFGGTVHTSPNMLQMRGSFEMFARAFPYAVIRNCSDGALISGFEPTRSAALRALPAVPLSAREALSHAWGECRLITDCEMIDMRRLDAFEELLAEWRDEALAVVSACRQADGDLKLLFDGMTPLLQGNDLSFNSKELWDTCRYVTTGTMMKVLHYLRYAASRVPEEDRGKVVSNGLDVLEEVIPVMVRRHLIWVVKHCRNLFNEKYGTV